MAPLSIFFRSIYDPKRTLKKWSEKILKEINKAFYNSTFKNLKNFKNSNDSKPFNTLNNFQCLKCASMVGTAAMLFCSKEITHEIKGINIKNVKFGFCGVMVKIYCYISIVTYPLLHILLLKIQHPLLHTYLLLHNIYLYISLLSNISILHIRYYILIVTYIFIVTYIHCYREIKDR